MTFVRALSGVTLGENGSLQCGNIPELRSHFALTAKTITVWHARLYLRMTGMVLVLESADQYGPLLRDVRPGDSVCVDVLIHSVLLSSDNSVGSLTLGTGKRRFGSEQVDKPARQQHSHETVQWRTRHFGVCTWAPRVPRRQDRDLCGSRVLLMVAEISGRQGSQLYDV